MKPKVANLLLVASVVLNFPNSLQAADIVKADNPDNLNLGTSWVLGTAPGLGDIAVWDISIAGASSTILGANQSWLGIRVGSPGGAVNIGAGNTLTLGKGGIDMSGASQGLTINSLSTLGDTAQTWNAGNQALSITSFTRTTGSTVNMVTSGGGSINIASGTAGAALGGYAVLNSSDYAALDASKNVVAATYANYSSGGSLSGITPGYVGILNVTGTTTGATQAWRNSNALNVASGVRFGVNNTQNTKWTVDTSSSGRVLTTPSILVGSAVTQNIEFNGAGGVRAGSSASELLLQNFGSGSLIFNTTINNPSSGSHSLTKSGTGAVVIASASGYNGVTRINQGTLQLGNGGAVGSIGSTSIINSGNLGFNRSDVFSAGYAISGDGSVTQSGSGTLSLTGTNTYTGATHFNAGTVSFNALSNFGNGTALNFNGGALSWNAVSTDISTRTVTIASGGAVLNTNGNNVTLANSIGNSGAGGLTKSGSGTLTLNGTSYTGPTTVTGGTLVANGTLAGGATVNTGGVLGGSGTYSGTISINSGGVLAPGNSVGTITTAGLTLGTGSILNFEFNNTPANDFINVTNSGGLTINGGGFNLYSEGTTNAFSTVGLYNLIGYSGSIGGTGISALTTASVLNPQAGKNYGFAATGSFVTLEISNAGVIGNWNVDADGSWNDIGNWDTVIPNGIGETGNFSKALTASRTVTLDGIKTLGAISFNGGASPLGYTIAQGTSGYLALDNSTNQANVLVTSGDNAISADVAINSPSGVFAVADGSSLTVSGAVDGAGALVKSGGGTLDLTNTSNGYDGNTTIAGGTLGFSALGSLGDGSLAINGATLRYNAGNTADISVKTVTISANGATINTNGNDVVLANSIGNSGTGGLSKSGAGTLTLGGANSQTGATSVAGGTLSVSSNANLGDVAAGAGLTLNGGTLQTTASMALDNAGANFRNVSIGAGGGTFSIDSATTLTVGGTVSGSAAIIKSGAGTLTLTGNNSGSLAGAISVNNGTLQLGGAQSNGQLAAGTGAITLNGATLRLNGAGATDNGTGYGNLVNAIVVPLGQTGTLVVPKRVTISSALTGAGTLEVGVDGTRQDYQGNWSAFTGQINLTGAGEFRIANFQNNVFNNSKLNIGAGISVYQTFNPPNSGNFTTVQNIGELSGAAGSSLGGNPVGGRFVEWTVGGLNTNSTYSGSIADGAGAAKLAKVGTGILTLEGTSTYTGATTVSAGTLLVNGSLGNTAVAVSNSATLGGTGAIAGAVTVSGTATLSPGASVESLATGALTMGSGTTFVYEATDSGATGGDLLAANGSLSLIGVTLDLTGANLDLGTWQIGDKLTLISYTGTGITGGFNGYSDDTTYTGGIFGGNQWFFDYNDSAYGDNFSSDASATGTSFVTLTVVPEPASVLLGSLGLLALLRRRR